MRNITDIIVHCSATTPDMDVDANLIRKWHVEERKWSDIGYHYVIKRDGTIEDGRPISKSGAHCRGANSNSIGVCLVGGSKRQPDGTIADQFNFTFHQMEALLHFHEEYYTDDNGKQINYADLNWSGHRDHDSLKECPTFDVRAFITDGTITPTI